MPGDRSEPAVTARPAAWAAPRAAVGVATRGTTAPNRLRRFDRWILHRMEPALRAQQDPVVVDLGFGDSPITTLELADRVAAVAGRRVDVVGIEIDPHRVARARAFARRGLTFAVGGFEVPLADGRRPLVIRAANVLRQYDEGEVAAAWAIMHARLVDGGVLVEGTCDELGRVAAWVTIPGGPVRGPAGIVRPETLTLSLSPRHVDRPSRVAERLPKALIHRNVPGQPIHRLLRDLDAAWQRAAGHAAFGPGQRWLATVSGVGAAGWPVLRGRRSLGELTVPWEAVMPVG